MKIRNALFHLLSIFYSISVASANSIVGCGGFVEASSSLIKSRKPTDAKLDYSHITVELRTVDNLVKDRTQCAPNGYYFIPVYDKGSFVLKINGPKGWSWEPEKVPVIADDSGCNNNEDINFRFTGFTISGRVVGAVGGESCSHKNGGPSNVKVELLSLTDDHISTVLTSSTGSYLFRNILPGKYNIRASHPDLKVEVRGSTEVELGFKNAVIDDVFYIPGYDIHGFVTAQGNPILGVHIFLYSDDVVEVECFQGSGSAPGQRKPLCHAVSDADGLFSFKSIPCGVYELMPYYKGENTVFDVSPSIVSVSMEHQHLTVPQKFQVTGFSVGGRVVDGNDVGVEGVKIIVDGYERSITDKEGYYKLDQVTSNRYIIEARKEHYKFDSLKDYLVLPNMASITDIKAVSYDVCGVVEMITAGYKAKVALTHGPVNVKPQMKQTDGSGKFCFEVLPGEYRLSVLAATPENAAGLLFSPPFLDVMVKSPLLNVEFSQAIVNILGSVTCKKKCGPSVSIKLSRWIDGRRKEERTINLTDESDQFFFRNVIPGKYGLQVMHNPPNSIAGSDVWCWERDLLEIVVGAEDVNGIEFIQKGYCINIVSTHDVDAYMTKPDGSHVNLKIMKGAKLVCVESPGVHELQVVHPCISFGDSLKTIDTLNPLPIYLKGEKYLVNGQISIEPSLVNGLYELHQSIIVDILNSQNSFIGSTGVMLASDGGHQSGNVVYEYSTWANLGEKMTFVPKDSRNNGEQKILFYPKQHIVSVTNDGCQASQPFFGRLGLYIEGSVSPPLADVYIRIVAAEDGHISLLKKGEIALETTTGIDGLFVGGPLYDDITYSVEASKAGYHLKHVGPHSFSCQKLGQISVHINSKDHAREPIPSVLLSLSGDEGYRNNSISGAGGSFLFDSLFPGSFYLRPLLKEYAFSPPTLAIELGSGESKEVTFEATRVAYSAMGMVTLLSGLPKEGVSVEARSESEGYYEETITDSSGSYRLRGLLPDIIYMIKVAKKDGLASSAIERASPEFVTVEVGSEDISGLDFLVFEQPEKTILSCHVEGKGMEELNSNLLVEIKSASDTSKIESVFPLPLSNFFQVKDLPKGKHLVQLKYSIPLSTHKFESEMIEVNLDKNAQIHVGPLRYKVEEDNHKQELTPAPVFPLIVGVSVIALFISIPRLKDLYQATVGIPTLGFITSVKKEARRPVVRKKTY
ncbi:putative carboxypeptidase regulatory region-containingprotein [Tripterygium wilfordii]|uniref:Putative carboxypeptidase regulatory region-containingprotein n=1 Tax=Tripterygium wilfordii TaxID=458696 RepID=A0A7J7DIQ3_TRIWF|nr:nodal modulator 1 [Tripterygium wilfordii]KAF5745936.1 putative carboxypeptidase regulatory region-containingprotein [Tripterygium wilfordii]